MSAGNPEPQLNATPLIDVLLVLLVMLIFTLPIATHAVKLNLPHGPEASPLPVRTVRIEFDGRLYWDDRLMPGLDALAQEFRGISAMARQPRVRIAADGFTRYENVARVLAAAQRSGVTNLSVN